MASVNVRGIILSQTATFNSKKQELTVTQIGDRFKRDPETHQPTSELEGYLVNVLSPRTGEVQSVKLPLDLREPVEKIRSALDSNLLVIVSFKGTFKGRFWAMLGDNGRVNMGITATASELEIISIDNPDDDAYLDMD